MKPLKILGGHTPEEVWALVKGAASAWIDDYAPSMGAALSYYTVFSLAPLLLIVISIAGLVFGEDAARGEIFAQLKGFMGADAASAVQELLKSLNKPAQGITGAVIGVGVLLLGATTVFGELQDALDRIWRAPKREGGGLWSLLRARLLVFGMILGIAFLLMVSLVLGAVIAAIVGCHRGLAGLAPALGIGGHARRDVAAPLLLEHCQRFERVIGREEIGHHVARHLGGGGPVVAVLQRDRDPLLVLDDTDPLGSEDLATHVLELEDAPQGYEIFQRKEDNCVKVLLTP